MIQIRELEVDVSMADQFHGSQAENLVPIGDVVAELSREYADITHSSLRFLEREGLVRATRTPGGHRLYAPADINRIRQIKDWQRIRLSLDEIRQRLDELERLPEPSRLASGFLEQALEGDLLAASRTILSADDVGMPLPTMFGDVLRPALIEVGRLWERGELMVAQEKEISELARDLIAELSRRHAAPNPRGPSLVAACVEGERHELGLRMVCGLLSAKGMKPHYLGANVASRFLLEAVRAHRPAAILLSATLESTLFGAKDAIDVLRAGLAPDPLPPVVVGGEVAIGHAELLRSWGAIPRSDLDFMEQLGSAFNVFPDER
jgi:methanogenic corrinoid protein MtbC1